MDKEIQRLRAENELLKEECLHLKKLLKPNEKENKIKVEINELIKDMLEFNLLDEFLQEISFSKDALVANLLKKTDDERYKTINFLRHLCFEESIKKDEISTKKNIFNKQEKEIYKALCKIANKHSASVYPQISLSAILEHKNRACFAMSGKFVDFLIACSEHSKPLCVVEYFGNNHYTTDDDLRIHKQYTDKLKKMLLKKAGVKLIILDFANLQNEKGELSKDKLNKALKKGLKEVF
ncbi:DUF2726 domain-containing protein [Campylobacter sp. LR185c]|uniref:DUF2726 domain-containing protein n=1 Tax=Campylobacter sp. LR185c TaxID=2014525 RepID=UPI001237E3AE|nr:DUF2726 domain-containing protein [Campylobacter sp. LR185c]KAA6224665.1 DUF2726 domain-containing protein [Campylobacter sp. LR185c]KAA8603994.1 hypothetical protein CGP82_04980 [Campylobacter sp. LR185c]